MQLTNGGTNFMDMNLSIDEAMNLIEKLASAVRHASKFKSSGFSEVASVELENSKQEKYNVAGVMTFSVVRD